MGFRLTRSDVLSMLLGREVEKRIYADSVIECCLIWRVKV